MIQVFAAFEIEPLVEAAARAVVEHDEAVERIVAAGHRQQAAIDALRGLTVHAASAADAVAAHAIELATFAERLPREVDATRLTLNDLATSLSTVVTSVDGGRVVAQRLDAAWAEVAVAVDEVARTARRARVLAVNASIEAAYVDASRSGFTIVADRMRSLSNSTLDAARDVRDIIATTRTKANDVLGLMDRVGINCAAVAGTVGTAAEKLAQAGASGARFDEAVSRIAAIADQQRASAATIVDSVGRLSTLAAGASQAAQDAARGIGEGVAAARRALTVDGRDALEVSVRGLTQTAIAAARGAGSWRGVDEAVDALGAEFSQVGSALEESSHAARTLDGAAGEMVEALALLDAALRAAVETFDRAIGETATAVEDGRNLSQGIASMRIATDRAEPIVDAVGEISAESSLLALNAAIEAARAGERGLGFTVIADEIGRLAHATQMTTEGIAEAIGKLRARGLRFEAASGEGETEVEAAGQAATRGSAAVDGLRATVAASLDRAQVLRETARALGADTVPIGVQVTAARAALGDVGRESRNQARLVLSGVLGAAQQLAYEQGLDTPIVRIHTLLLGFAAEVEAVYAQAIASGATSLDALRDAAYVELRGSEVAHLERFVDVSTVPRDGFDPPKYRTAGDAAVDRALIAIMDRTAAGDDRIASMGVFDLNGFALAMDGKIATTTDWARNRVKRILDDPIQLRMARVGLGEGAEGSGRRRTWTAFERDGYMLERVEPRPWIALAYLRDTGAVFITFGAALYVGETRVGTASCLVDAERVLTTI
jgi:methyl-accepting chemotaxis protein